jgi:gamma-glutamyl-gamma-aminobutyrate hydrolase PuuD
MKNTYYIPTGTWPLKIQLYQDLLSKAGFVETTAEEAYVLVLPGGSDIGIRKERDLAEFRLYEEWTTAKKPVLGICRGLQIMLYMHDGDLVEHIPDKTTEYMHTTITGDWKGQSSWHNTELGLLTNSRHHQGYSQAPDYWEVIDKTEDGIIEAVQWKNQFAVQWHPEHDEMNDTPAQEWWIKKAIETVNYDKNLQC